jgi:hypothetical protein
MKTVWHLAKVLPFFVGVSVCIIVILFFPAYQKSTGKKAQGSMPESAPEAQPVYTANSIG